MPSQLPARNHSHPGPSDQHRTAARTKGEHTHTRTLPANVPITPPWLAFHYWHPWSVTVRKDTDWTMTFKIMFNGLVLNRLTLCIYVGFNIKKNVFLNFF